MKFDVYGRTLVVERLGQRWVVSQSSEGRRSPAPDIIIPDSLAEGEIATYLTDLFHELATPERPNVRRIG